MRALLRWYRRQKGRTILFIYTMKPQPQPAGKSYRSGYGRIPAAVKVPSVSKTVSKQETAEKLFQTVNQLIREIGKVVE